MLLNPLTFHNPSSLEEAVSLYSTLQNVRLQAGGTFLLNSLKLLKRRGAKTPDHVISLGKIQDLKGLQGNNQELTVLAMTTISDIYDSALLTDNFGVLKTVCRNISTQPIRNMATIGGNLTCRYTWTEMPAVMVALNGQMHFTGLNGQKETIAAQDFFKNGAKTDKIFTHVTIKRDKEARIAYRRVKKTINVDIPLLSVCINTHIKNNRFQDTRVAVNNCVAFAQRDGQLEEFLNKSACSPAIAEEALDHMDKSIYDTRSDDYKKHMFRVSIKNAIKEIVDGKSKK